MMSAFNSANRLLVAFIVLLILIAAVGITQVYQAQDVRRLYQRLSETQVEQDKLLAEHSRLLLEHSAHTSLSNVERHALQKLEMQFPSEVNQVPK